MDRESILPEPAQTCTRDPEALAAAESYEMLGFILGHVRDFRMMLKAELEAHGQTTERETCRIAEDLLLHVWRECVALLCRERQYARPLRPWLILRPDSAAEQKLLQAIDDIAALGREFDGDAEYTTITCLFPRERVARPSPETAARASGPGLR